MRIASIASAAVGALILSCVSGAFAAHTSLWRDSTGQPAPETESMRSKGDFAGALIATTDVDWAKQWDTPPDTQPAFNKASVVPYGKKVYVLMFFANPMTDAKGDAVVRCDFRMVDPNGKVTLEQKDATCWAAPIAGNPTNMRLSGPVITFVGDPGDPAGVWATEVVLRDAVRGVELPLRTTFTLQ